ncbi:MAG TPA: glutamine synthetase, partial [Candidatus Marinimicrobia bacterium]|nr:glutamine synthetase [Candidatus Neomarinimicrobiota bacterium]
SDLLNFIKENNIKRISFHYTALDGRLKQLIIPVNSMDYAERVLAAGERVDGSSLFKKMVPAGGSDLYVVPDYSTAFINPFDPDSISLICRYLDKNEKLAEFAPDNILAKAAQQIRDDFGMELWGLGELEFYIIGEKGQNPFQMSSQSGYHEGRPFSHFQPMLLEMIDIIAGITGHVKYGHSEVGVIQNIQSANEEINGKYAEQFEVEFMPAPIEKAADFCSIAKWVVRSVAAKHNCMITFIPKLEKKHAGTGMHFHLELLKKEDNQMTNPDGSLSDIAKIAIGGLCDNARVLTAFGNTTISSYLRLVPNQESPTSVFWSDMNRSAMVRVPLGWKKGEDTASLINHKLKERYVSPFKRQTIELRTSDGSAHIHLLLAAITKTIHTALGNREKYLSLAEKHYLQPGNANTERFPDLPASCYQSAMILVNEKEKFGGIFPDYLIEWLHQSLLDEDDKDLRERLSQMSPAEQSAYHRNLMHQDLHIR